MDLDFIEKRIEQQKEYIAKLDLKVHLMTSARYRELRESAAGVLRDFWERRKKYKNVNEQ